MQNSNEYNTNQAKEIQLMQSPDLQRIIIDENYLGVIENALWSMKALVVENAEVEEQLKEKYDELFNIALTRFQNMKHILEP